MKKLLAAFSAVAALGLTAAQAAESLTVAATPVPHAEILNVVKPLLAKEGVDLKIKEFTDYVQPNVQVSEKRLTPTSSSTSRTSMSSTRPRAPTWSP